MTRLKKQILHFSGIVYNECVREAVKCYDCVFNSVHVQVALHSSLPLLLALYSITYTSNRVCVLFALLTHIPDTIASLS